MALRRTAAMLLSRTLNASKAAPQSELHAATAALPCARQPQQLTSLARFVAAPALQGSARTGGSLVSRSYASEAYDSPPLGLKEALKSELEYEHDNYEPEGDLPAQPPSPWTLTESPGDSQLKLMREYNGETIEVVVMADECHDEEDAEDHELTGLPPHAEGAEEDEQLAEALEEAADVAIVASANIAKNGKSLDVVFRTNGEYVEVTDVSLGKPDVTDEDDTAYAGPKYEELDEQVQAAFDDYLEQRGIDAEFGDYLMKLAADKEQREYVGWLQKVHDIV